MKNGIEYRMRAECIADLGRALKCISVISLYVEVKLFPDVEIAFISSMTLPELRADLAKVEDGHVMIESLNLASKYTGERYIRQKDLCNNCFVIRPDDTELMIINSKEVCEGCAESLHEISREVGALGSEHTK